MHVLLNWLVQGMAVTAVVALGVRAHGTMTAATRERIWWVTMMGLTLMPVAYLLADLDAASRTSLLAAAARPDPFVTVEVLWNRWAALVLTIWAARAIVHLARVGVALVRLQRTKQSAGAFPRDREARLAMWTTMRPRGRLAALVTSSDVYCAAVLGLDTPLIAVTPDALDRLTDEELDQIVLHEYAHIQRRDDLAIVAQRIISAVAGLHPAVWWLDRALTIDREVACDDWVVTYAGTRTRYAQCLVKLASCVTSHRRPLAPGAVVSRSQLSIRVAALLDSRRSVSLVPSRATFLIALPSVIALVVACVAMPLVGVAGARPLQTIVMPAVTQPGVQASHAAVLEAPVSVTAPDRRNAQPRGPARLGPSNLDTLRQDSPSASTLPMPVEEVSAVADPLPTIALTHLNLGAPPAGAPGGALDVSSRDAPWRVAAEAGLAISSGSRYAAVKTAAAFSRFGKSFTSFK